jgi:hypothetical protein
VAGFVVVVVVVEEDAGDEGVCFEGEGMACGDGVEDSLADLLWVWLRQSLQEKNNKH